MAVDLSKIQSATVSNQIRIWYEKGRGMQIRRMRICKKRRNQTDGRSKILKIRRTRNLSHR